MIDAKPGRSSLLVTGLLSLISLFLLGPLASGAVAAPPALKAPVTMDNCVQVGTTCVPLLDADKACEVGTNCAANPSPTPAAAATCQQVAGTCVLDASKACEVNGATACPGSKSTATSTVGPGGCLDPPQCTVFRGPSGTSSNIPVDCTAEPQVCADIATQQKAKAAAAAEEERKAAVPDFGTAQCPLVGDAAGNVIPSTGLCDIEPYQLSLRTAIANGYTCWRYVNEQREISPCVLGAATANAPSRPEPQGSVTTDNTAYVNAKKMEGAQYVVTLDVARDFGALGAPALQWPNGGEGKIQLMLGWLKFMALAAGVAGLIICGIMMIMGRRSRSQTAVEGAIGVPWVLGGLMVVSLAATVLGAWTSVGAAGG